MPKPMPKRGNPYAHRCRHCDEPKLIIAGGTILVCETCDAPQVDGVTIKPTWRKP